MSSIRMIEGGKPSKEIKSVPYIAGRQLVEEGKAVYANLPTPRPTPPPAKSEEVKSLEAQIDRERRERAELEARLAAIEAGNKTPPK
jgi:hypothetical protein